MQQQQRNPQQVATVSNSDARKSVRPEATRSAPIVLDLQAMKQVSGGAGETLLPKKFW